MIDEDEGKGQSNVRYRNIKGMGAAEILLLPTQITGSNRALSGGKDSGTWECSLRCASGFDAVRR